MPYKYLFILSSLAGGGKSLKLKDKIIRTYKDLNLLDSLTIIETKYYNHAKDAALEFAKENGSNGVIYVCGGDGTINEVAVAIYGTETAIGVVPLGTANDFSKTIYENSDINSIIEKTPFPRIRPIDLMNVNGNLCINITSMGFDTKVLKYAYHFLEINKKLGGIAYFLGVFKALFGKKYDSLNYEFVDSNGETISGSGDIIISTICNGTHYGNGFNPAPDAKIDDGLIDICLVDNLKFLQLLPLIPKYRNGTHTEHKKVKMLKVKSGMIKTNSENIIANIDGEIFYSDTIEFKIIPSAINFAFV